MKGLLRNGINSDLNKRRDYSKENKQNKLSAKHFKANAIQEQAEATEELIATLTEAHTRQMETLVKTMTDAMKEMMLLLKENKPPTNKQLMRKRKRNATKRKRSTTTHLFVRIAGKSTLPKQMMNAGS
jgi:hypothetical protein